jgi:TolB-like protein/class 3 adenylate cyclase/Tfp pilus assembly protein PilF
MEADRAERKLSAILAADVAGYSRLIGADDEGTLASLTRHRRELIDPCIAKHRGRIIKTTGDGLLAEFASVVDAVRCAVEVQEGMGGRNANVGPDKRLDFRIGINFGDVVEQDGDIFGDGVNIAARLEGIAEPGGICVSERVHEDAAGKIGSAFEDIGDHTLKNIARPVRVYRLRPQAKSVPSSSTRPMLSLPDKPSIAVLPFENMSADAEQEYFADGIVEEIITALSRMRWLFVIARNSSFTYKGRAVDVKQVGRELGVRYVLEGSVRKAGNKVRITGQLIDTSTGAHLWADRFDGELADIFDLQDQVTASVVGAIAPKLEQAEIERAQRKPTESLGAYDYFLRGMAAMHQWTREGNNEAISHFYRAIELDPGYASAYGMAARCYAQRKSYSWVIDRAADMVEAARLARRAGELGRDDAVALSMAGIALVYVVGDLDEGNALIDRALALNPNLAWAWLFSGWTKLWLGEPEVAIERVARAMRLSPHDPLTFNMQTAIAAGHFSAGRYAEALSWAEISFRESPNFVLSTFVAAASAALANDDAAAKNAMARLRQITPELRISNLRDLFPIRQPEDFTQWAEGMRKAGLPE